MAPTVKRHARGPARHVHWRLPAPQVVAVAVEDLDAGGHVDDIEVVVGVDGHGPRLLEPALRGSAASPDLFQSSRGDAFLVAARGQQRRTEEQRELQASWNDL